jgi:hypothetical protein
VLSCPRCVQPVPPDAMQCPSCGYDIGAAAWSAPFVGPDQVTEVQPRAPLARPGGVTAAAPSDETGRAAPVADEGSSLIPGFTEGPPHRTGPPEEERRYWWIVGAVVGGLAVLAVIAVLATSRVGHRGATNATPTTTAALTSTAGGSLSSAVSSSASRSAATTAVNRQRGLAQASIIDGYLTDSAQARHGISAAISAISGCTKIASAVTTLHNAAAVRMHIVGALAGADVSALPNGAATVADLSRAMRASASADQHYAAWGESVAGCHGNAPHNAELAAAQQSDTVATDAKQRFADEWNRIAAIYGLAKQSADKI